MQTEYQARWTSKARVAELKKHRLLGQALLIDSFNGFIVIEPTGSNLADGPVLSELEAEYELQPVWSTGPKSQLREARQRLGLDIADGALATADV